MGKNARRTREDRRGTRYAKAFYTSVIVVVLIAAAVLMVFAQEDIKQSPGCKYCGMDREKFSQSRMHLVYDDGTTVGTCSLHCMALELAITIDKAPAALQVADYASKKLIDAEKAVWVLGGDKPGVMTRQAKWAFENKADAEKFIQESGGKLTTFDEAIKLSYEDMYLDAKMIREKRKMKKKADMEHGHQM
jgi:copper chaperone NosL